MAASAQESISLGKRLTDSEITTTLESGRLDGYSYITGNVFSLSLRNDGTAVFSASGADDTRASWAVDTNQLCFLYEGTTNWSCRLVYDDPTNAGVILVENRESGLVALSRLVPEQPATIVAQPANPVPRIADQACSFENAQRMSRADLSDYLNDKSYEGFVWGKSGQVYSTQQNLARVDERRAVLRLQALGRGFEGDAFINNDTDQLCQFMRKPDYTLMTCFDAVRLPAACPFDIALLSAETGALVSAYFDPLPIAQAPPITVYESRETVLTPPSNVGEWVATGIAFAIIWDQLFADKSQPASRAELSAMPQSECERTIADRTLFCSEVVIYGSTNTKYLFNCDGKRSENRQCRGWLLAFESTVSSYRDDYYCDPVTNTRGSTRASVFTQLCQ